MQIQIPLTRDLVMVGGGHAHALALRMWGMNPVPGVRVTLINPGPTAPYSGMLPGHIAGHYAREDLDIDLVRLARFAGARLVLGSADAIDPVAKVIRVDAREIAYDVASIDVGIHAEMPGITGFSEYGLGAKPLDVYAARWAAFLERVRSGEIEPSVAVIGGGVAGAELALAMSHAMQAAVGTSRVTVIEAGDALAGVGARAAGYLTSAFERYGVTLMTRQRVAQVTAAGPRLEDGTVVEAALTVGAAGAFAHRWLADGALPTTNDGFVVVGETLLVEGHSDLFAVGDCAHFAPAPRPKAGVYAVRAAAVLDHNLRAVLAGGSMRAFRPQKDFLKLISLGRKSALAQRWGNAIAGPVLWQWKNRIDQTFMDKFRDLPKMDQALPHVIAQGVTEALGGGALIMCAGCGGKVGPGVLASTLARMPQVRREDVLTGPGDDAAVLSVGGLRQVITTDHLRAVTEDPAVMARIAALHALGDIWAMGAKPQAALVNVTLPRQSEALQARAMEEIMAAAGAVFAQAGAEIVGGHTSMGMEMVIGFTITGLLDGEAVTVGGAEPGDVLILTRALGSGTLLAAEMKGEALGRDVARLFDEIMRSQGGVAAALNGAHALTDVTGFGLAGHLSAICRASGVGAEVDLAAVPLLDGALDLARAGHRSTIYPANVAAAPVEGPGEDARIALLYDPQTAGGFLAAVAPGDVDGLLAGIATAGGTGHVIGRIVAGPVAVRLV